MSDGIRRNSLRNTLINIQKESLLEAKDAYGTWYPAKVIAVKDEKVHVHFCNWSSRYDTWYPMTSDCLRVLKKVPAASASSTKMVASSNGTSSSSRRRGLMSSSVTQFQMGTYVMALWRNQYEYLAEVIAHRCRQGEKSEYRLRFVWDNVIEWTPAHKLRKATDSEVDYVLMFCREHGGAGSGKSLSDFRMKISPKSRFPLSEESHTSATTRSSRLPTRSQSRKLGSSDVPSTTSHSLVSSPFATAGQKTALSTGFETSEHGMVYDKSVLQFHEACRKRRELKRRAIEFEEHSSDKSVVLSDGLHSSVLPVPPCDKTGDPLSESDVKPPKYRMDDTPVSTLPSPRRVSVSPNKRATEVSTSGSSPVTCVKESPIKRPCTPSGVSAKKSPKPSSSPKVLLESTTKDTAPSKGPKQAPLSSPGPSCSPTTYPCPFCPRQLRHSKLLAAHISNYHKDASQRNQSTPPSGPVAPSSSPPPPPPVSTKPEHITADFTSSAFTPPPPLTEGHNSIRLLTCQPCDSRGVISNAKHNLIQCHSCLCWMHKSCYGFEDSLDESEDTFYCNGCRLCTRPRRSSRADEADVDWMRTGVLPWNDTNDQDADCKLIPEAADLLNWSYRLRQLLNAGWVVLNGTRHAGSSPVKSEDIKSSLSSKVTQPVLDGLPVGSQDDDLHEERNVNEDQVNRLYMELRASVVDNVVDLPPTSRRSEVTTLTPEASFTTSLPDSDCPAVCWPLVDEPDGIDVVTVDATISNHVLTGFLQDLGPNVISEFVDLNTESAGCVETSDVDEFLRRPSHSDKPLTSHSDELTLSSSAVETPTKGLGSLLSSPSGVATLLQAAITNTLPISTCVEHSLHLPHRLVTDSSMDELVVVSRSAPSVPLFTSVASAPAVSGVGAVDELSRIDIDESMQCTGVPSLSAIPDVLGHSLLASSVSHSHVPSSPIVSSPSRDHLPHSFAVSQDISHQPDTLSITSAPSLMPSEMDWLSVNTSGTGKGSYDLSFTSSLPFTKTTTPTDALSNASAIYDVLGSATSYALDAVTDVLTPDALCEAHGQLDHLDQFILTPLERALSVMEAQHEQLVQRLTMLEHESSASSKMSDSEALNGFEHTLLLSNGNSPFGSSSSCLSLSPPCEPILDESPSSTVADISAGGPKVLSAVSALDKSVSARSRPSKLTKRAARQLYRYTVAKRTYPVAATPNVSESSESGHRTAVTNTPDTGSNIKR